MRDVKCVYCEKYDNRDIMTNLKKRYIHYGCLEKHEKDMEFKEREKKELDRLVDYIKEVHNIKIVPSVFFPFLQDLRNGNTRRGKIIGEKKYKEGYEYNVIRYTYRKYKDNIKWAIRNKGFTGTFNMLKYTVVIVSDRIGSVEKAYKRSDVAKKREDSFIQNDKRVKEYKYIKSKSKEDISDIL